MVVCAPCLLPVVKAGAVGLTGVVGYSKVRDKKLTSDLLEIIIDFLCTHIKNQVKSGASVIQIFDSWAGLVKNRDLERDIYKPTKKVVKFIR